jgi:hypothetical protein
MLMTLYNGQNFAAESVADVEPVAPGIGRVTCPECGGKPEEYPSLFPPEVGVTQCVDCKGLGYVYVDI